MSIASGNGEAVKAITVHQGISVVILVWISVAIALAVQPARPLKPSDLVGIWVGYTEDDSDFARLDIRSDQSGYFATVSPVGSALHKYGCSVYNVRWSLDGHKLAVDLRPIGEAESIYLKGSFEGFSLKLEVGGKDGAWKRSLSLHRGTQLEASSREAAEKIAEIESKNEP